MTLRQTRTHGSSRVINLRLSISDATWCGPCKMMSPILDEISKEYEGKINVYKVNVDKEADLASVFGIRSIPSLLFVPMKKEPSMVQGAMPKNELKKLVDDILLESK